MSVIAMSSTVPHAISSRKFVTGLEFTAVNAGLIFIDSRIATRPRQEERGPKGKDDCLSGDICFDAYAFTSARHGEIQSAAENHRIGFVHNLARHLMKDLGFHQEGRRVRPAVRGDGNGLAALGKTVILDFREGTRTGDAGNSRIPELIARSSIQRR